MRRLIVLSIVVAIGLFTAGNVWADWDIEDEHKMHFPQLPNYDGYDVCLHDQYLADDFVCGETGTIDDIHLWLSFKDDQIVELTNNQWDISIREFDPSKPGNIGTILWQFVGGSSVMRQYGFGQQGWHCPGGGETIALDHNNIWQVNFTNLEEPMTQIEGTTYWLVVKVNTQVWPPAVGWKTADIFSYPQPYTGKIYGSYAKWGYYDMFNNTWVWNPVSIPAVGFESNDFAFVITGHAIQEDGFDWGDAPDQPYPTLAINNGANHFIVPGLLMGALIDSEPDGQPDPAALGDDYDTIYPQPPPNDDEDGVTFSTMIPGQPATMTVDMTSATMSGMVDAWIDFSGNGVWGDIVGEQIAVSVPVTAGAINIINFIVPGYAAIGQQTFARVRLSTAGGLPPTGPAQDGEVEDYEVWIDEYMEEFDWGDAPDPLYPTLAASGGANHFITGPYLDDGTGGDAPDSEPDGQPDPMALGDDNDLLFPPPNDDEDGIIVPVLTQGQPGNLSYFVAGASANGAWVQIWIDFNGDGTWAASEMVENALRGNGGPYNVAVTPSMSSIVGQTFLRARISTFGGLSPSGSAQDGEVEDHEVFIKEGIVEDPCDFGDLPRTFMTLLANNGPRHMMSANICLGATIDAEADGQPSVNADGDDLNGLIPDDEDGVVPVGNWFAGQAAQVAVTATAPGYLNAWIDFNNSGTFGPAEQIFVVTPLTAGNNVLSFNIPAGAAIGNLGSRWRYTSYPSSLGFTGWESDGEVEDHLVTIKEPPTADLGDAPDSSNTNQTTMTAYPGAVAVMANFPTVFLANSPPFGPKHLNPDAMAYLGAAVSKENEADVFPPDQDGLSNIDSLLDIPDRDGFDDSINPMSKDITIMMSCRPSEFDYTVTVVNASAPMFVNVFFDWNRDGDWDDSFICPQGPAPEHAVVDQTIQVAAPGVYTFTTPRFLPWSPNPGNEYKIWMRITLADTPYSPTGTGGSGPSTGYQYGETEDYYVTFYGDTDHDADLGDAPDSTNNYPATPPMTTYMGVIANFPTVYNDGIGAPFGPIHIYRDPLGVNTGAILGSTISQEQEADLAAHDQDGIANIDPPNNLADQDGTDDALAGITSIKLPDCDPVTVDYDVMILDPCVTYYVNMWFDYNRDADWDDTFDCCGVPAPEHAVVDQIVNMSSAGAGLYTITSGPFVPWHGPAASIVSDEIWMRITIAEVPWVGSGTGGSGPALGYMLGETEDYLLTQVPTCWDSFVCAGQEKGDANCNGDVDIYDFSLLAGSWHKSIGDAAYNCCTDFDHDGSVNIIDLAVMASSWLDTGFSPATGNSTCPW